MNNDQSLTNYITDLHADVFIWFFSCIYIVKIIEFLSKIKNHYQPKPQNKFQYLLEFPQNYLFDSKYLENVTDSSSPLIKCLDEYCKNHQVYSNGAIVSLSGGVDSMVTLAILIHLRKTHNFPIYTASIDYGLRDESSAESEFLIEYVKTFGIKSYVSYVNGISRKREDSGSRSEFEEESRALRFNTYKKIINENNLSSNCGVFVGHHQDDIIENIFTNSMRGGNLLDLPVMKSESKINGINLFRPFLGFPKSVIYDFSHKFSVPYFLDTTPKWSRRGKMRNEIFPLLDSVFGIDWRNKLKFLGEQSTEWGEYISKYVIDPWFEQVTIGTRGVIIPILKQPQLIYSHVILKSLHTLGESMIRKTSMDKIMQLIESKQYDKVITLDGNRMATLIKNNTCLMIFNTKFTKNNLIEQSDIYTRFINGDVMIKGEKPSLPVYLQKYFI